MWSPCLIPYKSCKGCNACASFSGWLTWNPINPDWQKCWICTAVTEAKEIFERAEHFTYYKIQWKMRSWGLTLKIIVHFKEGTTVPPLPGTWKMYLSNCKTAGQLCYGDPHLLVLYSTTCTQCSGRGTGHTVPQQQTMHGEAVGAAAQASRGRQGPGRKSKGYSETKAELKAFQTALLWTAHHFCVYICDFAFLLRCVWFLKDQGKAWVPYSGNQEPSRSSLQVSWTVLSLDTSSAFRSQRVHPPHATKLSLLRHVEESCAVCHTPRHGSE